MRHVTHLFGRGGGVIAVGYGALHHRRRHETTCKRA